MKPSSVKLQVRVPRTHAERFERVARDRGLTVSGLLRKHIIRVSHDELLRAAEARRDALVGGR